LDSDLKVGERTVADLQSLFAAVNELTSEELKQLYLYITESRVQFVGPQSETSPHADEPRILGLHAHLGSAWMSDDFRDELPDSFWLGEQ
jgi:hypothetical protein